MNKHQAKMARIANSRTTDAKELDDLVNVTELFPTGLEVYSMIVKNPNASIETLERIIKKISWQDSLCDYDLIIGDVARHENVTPDLLQEIASLLENMKWKESGSYYDSFLFMIIRVLQNEKCPEHILKFYANREDMIWNVPAVATATLKKLGK